jgi:hypothetical protein
MGTHQAERIRLGQKLTDAETKLRDLQAELDRTPPTSPSFSDTGWLVDQQREQCRLVRAEVERNENRYRNAVNRKLASLLREHDAALLARLLTLAERRVDPDGDV